MRDVRGLPGGRGGGVKFFHLLYVGSGVGIIKRNKAQLQKNAPFNAMDGAAGDLELPPDEKTAEKLAALVAAAYFFCWRITAPYVHVASWSVWTRR